MRRFGTVSAMLTCLCLTGVPARGQDGQRPASTAEALDRMWSQGRATGSGPVKLTNFPLRVEDIGYIIPMGMMASGHVTPSDHLYLVPKEPRAKGQRYDVLAVADGTIVVLQWRPQMKVDPDPTVIRRDVDLKVIIEHAATCWSYVDHLVEVEESLLKQAGQEVQPGPAVPVRIPVRGGQVIGKVGFQTFDFSLIDTTVTRKGFVVLDQFLGRDPWKPHAVDPFDYIAEPLKSRLLALDARKVEPRGGKIDYDVDGRLVGNWYLEGSGGYAGANRRRDYWVGHLTIAYHHIDPTKIVISLGEYEGKPQQFWVKGNAPDPAKVGAADGPVKYELVWGRLGTAGQPQVRHDADAVQGVALAQVLPDQSFSPGRPALRPAGLGEKDRKLKFETFPGKTAAQVTGFTSAARIYER